MDKIKYLLLGPIFLLNIGLMSCNSNNKPIMVVGVKLANFDEISYLIDNLENKKEEEIDGRYFYRGKINNYPVIIASSDKGMSDAAMTTTIGIKTYQPKIIINEGTSGGHANDPTLSINNIILGKDILDMSSYEGDPFNPKKWRLQNAILHNDKDLINVAKEVENKVGGVKEGIIASSNAWNIGKEFINQLHDKFKEDCEEMESYAVASVSNNYKIPNLSIRIISNNLIMNQPYNKENQCGLHVQEYTFDVIKALTK